MHKPSLLFSSFHCDTNLLSCFFALPLHFSSFFQPIRCEVSWWILLLFCRFLCVHLRLLSRLSALHGPYSPSYICFLLLLWFFIDLGLAQKGITS
ncbi:hypothetical protein BDV12DRAFT_47566 [Aspergillus spectabilis]